MCNCRGATAERSRAAQARAAHLVATQRIASLNLARTVANGGAARTSVRVTAVPRAGVVRAARPAAAPAPRVSSTVVAPVVTRARGAVAAVRPVRVSVNAARPALRADAARPAVRAAGMARPRV